jgi:hypothetical protein
MDVLPIVLTHYDEDSFHGVQSWSVSSCEFDFQVSFPLYLAHHTIAASYRVRNKPVVGHSGGIIGKSRSLPDIKEEFFHGLPALKGLWPPWNYNML